MVTALGIRPDGKNQGVSPQVHRHIISSQWTSDGIIYGLNVTGGTGLSYTVSAGTALIQPDGQNGEAVLAYHPGGQTPPAMPDSPDTMWCGFAPTTRTRAMTTASSFSASRKALRPSIRIRHSNRCRPTWPVWPSCMFPRA